MNVDARVIETDHAQVPAEMIFDTGLFDFDKAQDHPLWAKELYGFADRVPARLLCTYRGKGTEYAGARHDHLPDEISRMQPGDAGIFRGADWPGMLESGVVHRSPPMVAGDVVRLLLVLDVTLPDGV